MGDKVQEFLYFNYAIFDIDSNVSLDNLIFRKVAPRFLSSFSFSAFGFRLESILSGEMTCVFVSLASSSVFISDKEVSRGSEFAIFSHGPFSDLKLDGASSFWTSEFLVSVVLLPLLLQVLFSRTMGLSTVSELTKMALYLMQKKFLQFSCKKW